MIDGKNIVFAIYGANNEPFHDLKLHKATYDSVVMSLGDKITGDVYYKDASLACSMQEYIIYDGVRFNIVNPPTIVREGMVSDNGDLKGMTKYSFEFYHPMYMLNNMPFSDIAVTTGELRYKSQDKIFAWVGYLTDYIAKLNKNLEGTQWVCEQGENIPQDKLEQISDVLSFSNNTIGDALKTEYDTWGIPYVIDILKSGDTRYTQGKRFLIYFGKPANEIYASELDEQHGIPFVFKFGQGVGLKNNSATPKNNKIVTRIAGYGGERNIPFGYPQIVWTGAQDWDFTINNDGNNTLSYPIYKGIYGGQLVCLIKHPFTRSHLMPSIYVDTIAKKVDPYNAYYDPNTEIIDYHDADDESIYPHVINPLAPSYETHEFENIYPELGEEHIVAVKPINNDMTDADDWDDTMDDDGNYVQSYFKLTLPQLDFDLYACAAITEEMKINMRSGACIGCTFDVEVDWEDYKVNFYDEDGNFVPNGSQRNLNKYPNSRNGQITIICKKEIETFGTLMPNIYQKPKGISVKYDGDRFVILGISLPQTYITNAQQRLDAEMDSYMLKNNVYYFEYPLKFDEYFLANNLYILSQIKNNTIVRFEFQGNTIPLYIKQLTIKYGESALPKYDISLTDEIEVVLTTIAQISNDVDKALGELAVLKSSQNNYTDPTKLSKINDDTARGIINFSRGLTVGDWVEDSNGAAIHQNSQGNWVVEADYLNVRKKLQANEVEIMHSSHIGGRLIATGASLVVSNVEHLTGYVVNDYYGQEWTGDCYKCWFNTNDGDGNVIYNTFKIGDLAYCETFNLVRSEDGTIGNHFYWRLVVEVGSNFITLSNKSNEYAIGSEVPFVGDHITMLGSRAKNATTNNGQTSYTTDTERQNAIIIAGAGAGNPYIRLYKGIDTFVLPLPTTQLSPSESWITVEDQDGNPQRLDDMLTRMDTSISVVREQSDKQLVIWFGDVAPTTSNEPAVNWTDEDTKALHEKDIYYIIRSENNQGGRAYSWERTNGVWGWLEITDRDVLAALETAADAEALAGTKKRVFVDRPIPPYDIGDLWVNAHAPTSTWMPRSHGKWYTFPAHSLEPVYYADDEIFNNDIARCVTAKEEGDTFNVFDWEPANEITTARFSSEISALGGRIDLAVKDLTTNLEVAGVHIDGANSTINLNADTTIVSDDLVVHRLLTRQDEGQGYIDITGSMQKVFGSDGNMNIEFGVDERGNAVLKYYDKDGNLLYDLGPNGIRMNQSEISAAWISLTPLQLCLDSTYTTMGDLITAVQIDDTLLGELNEFNGLQSLETLFRYRARRVNGVIQASDPNDQYNAERLDGLICDDNILTANPINGVWITNDCGQITSLATWGGDPPTDYTNNQQYYYGKTIVDWSCDSASYVLYEPVNVRTLRFYANGAVVEEIHYYWQDEEK